MALPYRKIVLYLSTAFVLSACGRTPISPSTSTDSEAFDVVVVGVEGNNAIQAIKGIREATGWGLREAKDFVDSLPNVLRAGLPEPEAKVLAQQLRRSHLVVQLRRRRGHNPRMEADAATPSEGEGRETE